MYRQAWQWALANRAGDGALPSGLEIARQYGRHERWGRLVKRSGAAGEFRDHHHEQPEKSLRAARQTSSYAGVATQAASAGPRPTGSPITYGVGVGVPA